LELIVMRFRSFLSAAAVVVVALAGSVGLSGTAEAATPAPARVVSCGAGAGTVTGSTCTLPGGRTCTVSTGSSSCSVYLRNRFGYGNRIGGGLYGGAYGGRLGGLYGGGLGGRFGYGYGFNPRLGGLYGRGLVNGNLLPLPGGYNLDVCDYPTYRRLAARQAFRLAAIKARLGQGDFPTLYAQLVAQADC
jgi:hypothetical protein